MYLYLDTTQGFIIGLFNKDSGWIEYLDHRQEKSSKELHSLLWKAMEDNELEWKDIKEVIKCSGPGSYTGMRLGDGICQVLEWHGFEVFSFYHFEVPKLLKQNNPYFFVSKAFKGEYFFYQSESSCYTLKKKSEVSELLKNKTELCYSNNPKGLAVELDLDQATINSSSDMVKDNFAHLSKLIIEKGLKRELFYYRALEDEFKLSL